MSQLENSIRGLLRRSVALNLTNRQTKKRLNTTFVVIQTFDLLMRFVQPIHLHELYRGQSSILHSLE